MGSHPRNLPIVDHGCDVIGHQNVSECGLYVIKHTLSIRSRVYYDPGIMEREFL